MQGKIRYEGETPFLEEAGPKHTTIRHKLKSVLHSGRSPYQLIEVADSYDYGRMLILDGCVNLSALDETNYHEAIVHVPALLHPSPSKVLVIGGGDGGTVRELLRHETIRYIDAVEIDKEVVDICRNYFPLIAESFDDPRVTLHYADGIEFVREAVKTNPGGYDLIIIDSSDPEGPASGLFTRDFYEACRGLLSGRGILTAQSESPYIYPEILRQVYTLFNEIFQTSLPYRVEMPSYPAGQIYFMLGAKESLSEPFFDKERLAELNGENFSNLRYISEKMLGGILNLPPGVSEFLKK